MAGRPGEDSRPHFDLGQFEPMTEALLKMFRPGRSREFLQLLWHRLTWGLDSNEESALVALRYVQSHFYHPVHEQVWEPPENKRLLFDPWMLTAIGAGRCGQVNRFLIDLCAVGNIPGRLLQFHNHQGAELYFDGAWHYLDASIMRGGAVVRSPEGPIASIQQILKNRELVHGIPVPPTEALSNSTESRQLLPGHALSNVIVRKHKSGPHCYDLPYARIKHATAAQEDAAPVYGWNYSCPVPLSWRPASDWRWGTPHDPAPYPMNPTKQLRPRGGHLQPITGMQ